VLTEASISGKIDYLRGLKENVGTSSWFQKNRNRCSLKSSAGTGIGRRTGSRRASPAGTAHDVMLGAFFKKVLSHKEAQKLGRFVLLS
jgi:hypothetical protein